MENAIQNSARDVLDSGVPQGVLQSASATLNRALLLPPEHRIARNHEHSIACILAMVSMQ